MVQPSYTLLSPTLPPNPILSDVRLNKKSDINHEKYLVRLKSFYTLFNKQTHFWVEVAVWDRLYYKHINQHRPFHRFQRVQEVRRILKRIKAINLENEIARLYKSFWNAKTIDKCTGKWNFIPSKESVQYTLHRLISASILIDKLKVVLIENYRSNSTLLKLEHFITLALVYMSLCSRLFALCNEMLQQIETCYQMLYEWQSTSFPSGLKQKEQEQFQNNFNLDCNEDTLKQVRASFSKEMMKLKSSDQHKVHLETYIASQAVVEKVKQLAKEIGADEVADMDDFEDLGEPMERE